jgi:hypothetical protein
MMMSTQRVRFRTSERENAITIHHQAVQKSAITFTFTSPFSIINRILPRRFKYGEHCSKDIPSFNPTQTSHTCSGILLVGQYTGLMGSNFQMCQQRRPTELTLNRGYYSVDKSTSQWPSVSTSQKVYEIRRRV